MNKLSLEDLKELWVDAFQEVTKNSSLSIIEMQEKYRLFKQRLVASGNSYKMVTRAEKEAEEIHHISLMKIFIEERHVAKFGAKYASGN